MEKSSVKCVLLATMIAKHKWGTPITEEALLNLSAIDGDYPTARDVYADLRSELYITQPDSRPDRARTTAVRNARVPRGTGRDAGPVEDDQEKLHRVVPETDRVIRTLSLVVSENTRHGGVWDSTTDPVNKSLDAVGYQELISFPRAPTHSPAQRPRACSCSRAHPPEPSPLRTPHASTIQWSRSAGTRRQSTVGAVYRRERARRQDVPPGRHEH